MLNRATSETQYIQSLIELRDRDHEVLDPAFRRAKTFPVSFN